MGSPTDVDISNFISNTLFSTSTTGPAFILLQLLRQATTRNNQNAQTPPNTLDKEALEVQKGQDTNVTQPQPQRPSANKKRGITGFLLSNRLYKIVRFLFIASLLLQLNTVLNNLSLNNYEWTSEPINPSDQIVVVTGGSGGLGEHYVQGFVNRNFSQVVIMDIRPPQYQIPPNVHFYKTDLTNGREIARVAEEIKQQVGDPTVIVHNAGTHLWGQTILDASEKLLKLTFEVNTIAPILVTQQFLPAMIEKNSGHIVTMASLAGYTTAAQLIDYSASKIGVAAFTEGLYQELKHRYGAPNVRHTLVNPTWIKAGMTAAFDKLNHSMSSVELEPEEVTDAVIEQVLSNRSAQLYLPAAYGFSASLRGWPNWLQELIRDGTKDIITKSNVNLSSNA